VISAAFAAAARQGLLVFNPAKAVDNLRIRKAGAAGREPFTVKEVAALVSVAEGDWRGLILCCCTTGLRISDAAALTWQAIDFERGELHVIARKTDTPLSPPLHRDFKQWLASQPPAIGRAYVFPSLAGVHTGGRHGLSAQFRELMQRAGITERIIQADGQKGRTRSSKSFHCLRHYFVSELTNDNVAADVRKLLVGHSDSKVHAQYSHHSDLILHDAINRLPSVLDQAAQASKNPTGV
jgi:integrase